MINLMRMDLKRLQKSKSSYVILAVIVFILAVQFLAVYVALNPDIQKWLSTYGFIFQVSGVDKMRTLSILQFFHLSMTQNFYVLIIGLFVVLFNCYERETGFIKNVLSTHVNKTHYITSKILVQSLYIMGLILVCFIEFMILNLGLGFFFKVDNFTEIFTYLILLWFIGIAVISMFTALTVWLRSKSGCVSIAIVYATGLWIMIVTTILNILGLADLMNYTLLYQVTGLLDLIPILDVTSLLRLFLVIGGFTILYTTVSIFGLSKKDV